MIGLSLLLLVVVLWFVAAAIGSLLPRRVPRPIGIPITFLALIGLAHFDYAWVAVFERPDLERRYASTLVHRQVAFEGYYDSTGSGTTLGNNSDPFARLVASAQSIRFIEMDTADARAASPFVEQAVQGSSSSHAADGRVARYVRLSLATREGPDCDIVSGQPVSATYRSQLAMPDEVCPRAEFSDTLSSRYEYARLSVPSIDADLAFDIPGTIKGLRDRETGQWMTECVMFSYRPWISRYIAIQLFSLEHIPWCMQVQPFPELIERAQSPATIRALGLRAARPAFASAQSGVYSEGDAATSRGVRTIQERRRAVQAERPP